MPNHEEDFKGHHIRITDQLLTINEQSITTEEQDGFWYTDRLPYQNFASLEELARYLVDKSAEFDTLSGRNPA